MLHTVLWGRWCCSAPAPAREAQGSAAAVQAPCSSWHGFLSHLGQICWPAGASAPCSSGSLSAQGAETTPSKDESLCVLNPSFKTEAEAGALFTYSRARGGDVAALAVGARPEPSLPQEWVKWEWKGTGAKRNFADSCFPHFQEVLKWLCYSSEIQGVKGERNRPCLSWSHPSPAFGIS